MSIMQVPEFRGYFPSEEMMDSQQRKFYRNVERSLDQGEFINIEGHISYVFVYLYKLLGQWNSRGFENLSEFLIYISELYSHENKLSDYCLFWAHDCLLGLNKFEEFLEKTEPKEVTGTSTHSSNLRINIQRKVGLPPNPIDILLMAGGRKTKFITNNQALYKDKIIECFDRYAEENQSWSSIFDKWLPDATLYQHGLFNGAPLWDKPELNFKIKAYYSAYEHLNIIKSLSKDAENLAREISGVPKIGEGWVSETELYRKLEKEFSTTKVIQHGQPSWIGRQHFDIWFPNWKIAVEYHGKQHFEPVDFFGGEKALKKTVERDKRKINLAKRHGVKLIVITEDDDQDGLVQNIYTILERRRILPPKA